MSLRQDRLTFFGVLIAVVIAVLGYLQLGSMYPLQGRADDSISKRSDVTENGEVEKSRQEANNGSAAIREDAPR